MGVGHVLVREGDLGESTRLVEDYVIVHEDQRGNVSRTVHAYRRTDYVSAGETMVVKHSRTSTLTTNASTGCSRGADGGPTPTEFDAFYDRKGKTKHKGRTTEERRVQGNAKEKERGKDYPTMMEAMPK